MRRTKEQDIMRIERQLGNQAHFAGERAFKR